MARSLVCEAGDVPVTAGLAGEPRPRGHASDCWALLAGTASQCPDEGATPWPSAESFVLDRLLLTAVSMETGSEHLVHCVLLIVCSTQGAGWSQGEEKA